MSESADAGNATKVLNTPTPPAKQRGGCFGRMLSALLVILITTALSLAGTLFGYIYLLQTPNQINSLRDRIATAETLNAELRAENSLMQTQVSNIARLSDVNRETIDELQQQQLALDTLRAELEAAARQNATVVAEARDSRDMVMLFATTEAGRAELITTLRMRSERIERFLSRLSDIAEDTALDLQEGSPLPSTPTPTAQPTPTPTAEEPSESIDEELTEEPTEEPTDTATSPTPRPTTTPRASATPSPTP